MKNNQEKRDMLDKKIFIFDQDGTVYLDFDPLPGAKKVINYLLKNDRQVVFISNNSSKSTLTYKRELSKILEIELSKDNIYTSTLAIAHFLRSEGITKIYPLGTPEFEEEITSYGIKLTDEDPQVVVVAFDLTLTYDKLKKACLLVRKGVDYIATHPDKVCPTKEGYIPDAGSIIALIETATGKKPRKILGKPNSDLIFSLLKRFNLGPQDAIIFGDRIYTDIRMGNDSGITTALMLTGESTIEDIKKYDVEPDFVFRDFEEVLELLKEIEK